MHERVYFDGNDRPVVRLGRLPDKPSPPSEKKISTPEIKMMISHFQRKQFTAFRSLSRTVSSIAGADKQRVNGEKLSKPRAAVRNAESLQSFQIKTNFDLMRTWIILRFSAIDAFVNHSEKVK